MVKLNRQGRFYSRILQEGRQARTSLSSTPLEGMGGNAGEFSRTGMEKVNWPYSKNTGKELLKRFASQRGRERIYSYSVSKVNSLRIGRSGV